MNHQHHRGDLHAIHNHAPGKSLVGPLYLEQGTANVLYAMRLSRLHGKLGDGRQQSLLRANQMRTAHSLSRTFRLAPIS